MKDLGPLKPLEPDFTLLKAGVFSENGKLRTVRSLREWEEVCRKGRVHAWFTHRLSPKEVLTSSAGLRLGKEIQKTLQGTCVQRIEIDLEPLPEAYDWFITWAKALKSALGPTAVHFAVPAEFSQESMEKVLAFADGIDWMVYDTGANNFDTYVTLLVQALGRLEMLHQKFAEKHLLMGIPAYYDRTKLHQPKIENQKAVLKALSQYKVEQKLPWCERRTDFAVYAGWTMTLEDKAHTLLIRAWRENLCKNG